MIPTKAIPNAAENFKIVLLLQIFTLQISSILLRLLKRISWKISYKNLLRNSFSTVIFVFYHLCANGEFNYSKLEKKVVDLLSFRFSGKYEENTVYVYLLQEEEHIPDIWMYWADEFGYPFYNFTPYYYYMMYHQKCQNRNYIPYDSGKKKYLAINKQTKTIR